MHFKSLHFHFIFISKSAFVLAVTLTFDHLTSKCNKFISAPNCTYVVSLVKFRQAVCKISRSQILVYDHTCTNRPKTKCLRWL